MSTIQLIGIGIAVVILIFLIIALIVTRRRERARGQASTPTLPVPPAQPTAPTSVFAGAPRDELHRLAGRPPDTADSGATQPPPAGEASTAFGEPSAVEATPAVEQVPTVISTRDREGSTGTPTATAAQATSGTEGPPAEPDDTAHGPVGPQAAVLWNGGGGPTDGQREELDLWGRPQKTGETAPTTEGPQATDERSATVPADSATPADAALIWTPAAGIADVTAAAVVDRSAPAEPAGTGEAEAASPRSAGPPSAETPGPPVADATRPEVVPAPEILEEPVVTKRPEEEPAVTVGGAGETVEEPSTAATPEPPRADEAPSTSEPAPSAVSEVGGAGPGAPPAAQTSSGRREPRLVRLCDIIGTTNTQLVDLNDAEVRRMLRELVRNEVDLAQQYKQLGQNIDAVLQLTEAQKICRALSMDSHAKLLEHMIRELQV